MLPRASNRNAPSWISKSRCVPFFTNVFLAHIGYQDWEDIRTHRTEALDAILESLGSQLVPPDFHQTSSDSSLFGSQHSDEHSPEPVDKDTGSLSQPQLLSPTLTVRDGQFGRRENGKGDRRKWKTLSDFVDERAIEDVIDTIEHDRNVLDVCYFFFFVPPLELTYFKDVLNATDAYPENLTDTISTIQKSLPATSALPPINSILESQAQMSTHMASHLESLASHYDQMAETLKESEAGEAFSEEDIQGQLFLYYLFTCLSGWVKL